MSVERDEIRDLVARALDQRLDEGPSSGAASWKTDDASRGKRPLITEKEVLEAHRAGHDLYLPPQALVTPLAHDAIERYRVSVRSDPRPTGRGDQAEIGSEACKRGLVAIASDHGGFEMKQALVSFLRDQAGIECEDLGCHGPEAVDYPDFAAAVARKVAAGAVCRGIVVDGAGIGSAMAANKVHGVRAAHCTNVLEARNAREHNDANLLTLGGRVIGIEMAKALVAVFLKTDFGGGRHQGRVDKIMGLES
ncbi:MAG: ribose 5-phosphate isomerase B [Planctomycetes bacterium]|nr:ribose 5-phosphate isomerase B [Planctomycetota bacterium]